MKILSIILIGISTIYTVYFASNWKKATTLQKIGVFLAMIVAAINGYIEIKEYYINESEKEISSSVGDLNPREYPMNPEGIYFNVGGKSYLYFRDGASQFSDKKALIKNSLNARIVDGQLFLDAFIYNPEGEPIANIYENVWKVYKPGFDYNNDKTGFEIITPDRKVLFQIYLEDTIVYLRGLVMSDARKGFYVLEGW